VIEAPVFVGGLNAALEKIGHFGCFGCIMFVGKAGKIFE
jgi:hypothetical protein